jgi:predicted  nucleic acid-binding Zn-ribbon protein
LLDTYGTEKDLETLRRRAEQDINSTIKAAENKIAEAHKQRKRFENEAEFYKKKQLPLDVDKGLRDADAEIGAQVAVITARKKDMEAIRIKFDEDLRRFRELTRRTPAGQ